MGLESERRMLVGLSDALPLIGAPLGPLEPRVEGGHPLDRPVVLTTKRLVMSGEVLHSGRLRHPLCLEPRLGCGKCRGVLPRRLEPFAHALERGLARGGLGGVPGGLGVERPGEALALGRRLGDCDVGALPRVQGALELGIAIVESGGERGAVALVERRLALECRVLGGKRLARRAEFDKGALAVGERRDERAALLARVGEGGLGRLACALGVPDAAVGRGGDRRDAVVGGLGELEPERVGRRARAREPCAGDPPRLCERLEGFSRLVRAARRGRPCARHPSGRRRDAFALGRRLGGAPALDPQAQARRDPPLSRACGLRDAGRGVPGDPRRPRRPRAPLPLTRPRQMRAATDPVLRALADTCDTEILIGLRNRALLLVGFDGAFRRSELVGIDAEHLARTAEGFLVDLPSAKGDQAGEGTEVPLAARPGSPWCPVEALERWLDARARPAGAVFVALRGARHVRRPGAERLSAGAVARIVKGAAVAAGLDGTFGAHSLRRGLVTTAIDAGVPIEQVMRHVRHRRLETTLGYAEARKAEANHPRVGLGSPPPVERVDEDALVNESSIPDDDEP